MSLLRTAIIANLRGGAKWTDEVQRLQQMRFQFADALAQAVTAEDAAVTYQQWLDSEKEIAEAGLQNASADLIESVQDLYSRNKALQDAWGQNAPAALRPASSSSSSASQRRSRQQEPPATGGASSAAAAARTTRTSSASSSSAASSTAKGQKRGGPDDPSSASGPEQKWLLTGDDKEKEQLSSAAASSTMELTELRERDINPEIVGRFAAGDTSIAGSKYPTFDNWYNAYTSGGKHKRWADAVLQTYQGLDLSKPSQTWQDDARTAFQNARLGQVQGSQSQITAAQNEGEFEFPELDPSVTEDLNSDDDDDFAPDF